MKLFKKIMAVAITLAMALALCVPAFADEGDSNAADSNTEATYTITAPGNDHQYEIYQIFTGDYSNGILSNEKWGANGTGTKGDAVSETILTELKNVKSSASDADKLAVITKYADLKSTPVGTVTNGSTYKAVAGYYLIKDKDNTVTGNDAYTTYIVQVLGNVTIKSKSDVPSFEKKLKDTNDTTGETSGWQDSADYDIGDQVPFKLEGTIASNYDDYKTYYYAFHDKEEKGLTFNKDSVKVYVGEQLITSNYYQVVTNPTDGCTFEVVFNDLKAIQDSDGNAIVTKDSKIRVEYTSELNDDAVLGNQGNVNKAKLEFSNNPNEEQKGDKKPSTGDTPWDNVIVFTYKVVVDKYANSVDGEKLPGAEFTLEKVLANGNKQTITVVKSNNGTTFTFKGLDDGDYILTETKTPAGYNTIDAIKFTVKADHTIEWDGDKRTDVLTDLSGKATTGDITFTANTDKSELATKVVNKQGFVLPSTGGIGTTIFYVIGGLLMAAAAVLFVTKKRVESDK